VTIEGPPDADRVTLFDTTLPDGVEFPAADATRTEPGFVVDPTERTSAVAGATQGEQTTTRTNGVPSSCAR